MPNLNPAVNLAGANVGYYSDSGDVVAASYGFQLIKELGDTPLGPCVAFVLNDVAGDFSANTIAFVTPIVLGLDPTIPPEDCVLIATSQGALGPSMLPYGIETDKNVLLVRVFRLVAGVASLDKIPFTIAIQAMTGDGQTFSPVPPPPPLSRHTRKPRYCHGNQ